MCYIYVSTILKNRRKVLFASNYSRILVLELIMALQTLFLLSDYKQINICSTLYTTFNPNF